MNWLDCDDFHAADGIHHNVEALKRCYDVMGAEHLLYSTGYPLGRYDVAGGLVEQQDCPALDRDLIYNGNAERLLNSKDLTNETLTVEEKSLKTK